MTYILCLEVMLPLETFGCSECTVWWVYGVCLCFGVSDAPKNISECMLSKLLYSRTDFFPTIK